MSITKVDKWHYIKKIKRKIQKNPSNYHRFFRWHSKLSKLGFRPPKLPDTCILAPSVSFGRLTGRKPSHVRVTWLIFPKNPSLPLSPRTEIPNVLCCLVFFSQYFRNTGEERRGEEVARVRAQIHRKSQIELAVAASDRTRLSADPVVPAFVFSTTDKARRARLTSIRLLLRWQIQQPYLPQIPSKPFNLIFVL
jgi:hypothetical protein